LTSEDLKRPSRIIPLRLLAANQKQGVVAKGNQNMYPALFPRKQPRRFFMEHEGLPPFPFNTI
jgi:hypothetical protein